MKNTDKVTLTVGQLKRLIKESLDDFQRICTYLRPESSSIKYTNAGKELKNYLDKSHLIKADIYRLSSQDKKFILNWLKQNNISDIENSIDLETSYGKNDHKGRLEWCIYGKSSSLDKLDNVIFKNN